jgi:hypothetical protein
MGGHPVKSFPFTGQLRMSIEGCDFEQKCTAVIVAPEFLISASHCVAYDTMLAIDKCENLGYVRKTNIDTEK